MASSALLHYHNDVEPKSLESLPDDMILQIFLYVGKGYLGVGAVNRRFNQIFKKNSSNHLLKLKTCIGGYTPLNILIQTYEREFESYDTQLYHDMDELPNIYYNIVVGIVSYNREDLLKAIFTVGGHRNKELMHFICFDASFYGRLKLLKRMFETLDHDILEYIRDIDLLCPTAAKGGQIECLKFLRSPHHGGHKWKANCTREAAGSGDLECLRFLHEHDDPCAWDFSAFIYAAKNGHIECLEYLYENGCECNKWACVHAAKNGHLNCLQYLYEHRAKCPWNSSPVTLEAAKNGHLDILTYLNENDHAGEWTSKVFYEVAKYGCLDCVEFLHTNVRCPFDSKVCLVAAKYGRLDCLRYLHEVAGCPWNTLACQRAAENGHIDCLRYMFESGLQWHDYDIYLRPESNRYSWYNG